MSLLIGGILGLIAAELTWRAFMWLAVHLFERKHPETKGRLKGISG